MDSQYDIYLAKLLANNNQKKMIVDGPMISIFGIVTEDFHVDSFMETLESVKGQTYNNWELILLAPSFYKEEIEMATAKVANYQNVQISVQYGMRFFEQGESEYAKEINAAKGSVIGFVNINDEYPSNAFCEIAEFFQENENCEFVYTDEDYVGLNGERILPHFKTDFSLDLLYSSNFLKNAFFIKKNLLEKAGGLNFEYKNGILFDLILRLQESKTTFYHLPKVLYSKRNWKTQQNHNLLIEKKYYNEMAILDHFKRRNLEVELIEGAKENTYRTKFLMKEKPLVSIIIPFKDQIDLLKVCVNSLLSKTSYANYELLLISNNSKEEITFNYLDSVKEDNSNVQYFEYNVPFNYSKINNWAAKKANGKYLLFLNNDTEIVEKDWLSSMMEHMQREEVGAVGARLLYEHNSLQHDGVVYGICDMAEHAFRTYPSSDNSRHPDMGLVRNVSVATAACLLMKRKLFEEIGGFDEKNLTVAYNDVDLCMELSKKGYLIVQTPYALMYHYESKSRGYEDTSEKYKRFMKEQSFMRNKWKKELIKGDPFYSPNLSKVYNDYSLDI